MFNVHPDICVLITPITVDNKRYFMMFMEKYTNYCVTYLVSNKSDLPMIFKDYIIKSNAGTQLVTARIGFGIKEQVISIGMQKFFIHSIIFEKIPVIRWKKNC